ncbi:hypothetical protein [Shewanella xiamenensis]|uniref:hypothetical protein n=1 Tax=Shewanella xiamenensis TaxID=332186 RepID=UPI00313BAC85
MEIDFDVVIESDDYSVEMSKGLETLQGASEVTRQVFETILLEKVPQHLTTNSKVRTKLMRSFKGSYGQSFCLETDDQELEKRLKSIGKQAFAELLSYFINESLYRETKPLSVKAEKIRAKLGPLEDELISQMRKSSLAHLHSVSTHFGKTVKLRYRKNRDVQTVLADLDQFSFSALNPKVDKTKVVINASITRLNINTGNGRLQIEGEAETVAFGFPNRYADVRQVAKKQFSKNLDDNNGLPNEKRIKLKLEAHTLKLKSGKIIKYLIEGIIN